MSGSSDLPAKRRPRRARVYLLPEVTAEAQPEYRRFLDLVPTVRHMQEKVVGSQVLRGEEIKVPWSGREVVTYLHRVEGSTPRPVIFEFHGGGFVFGSAATDDRLCEALRDFSGLAVVGVDYPLAPEVRFPDPGEAVWTVIQWYRANASVCGIDPERIFLLGFSAGANLATAAAQRGVTEGASYFRGQALHYPYLDHTDWPEEEVCDLAEVDPELVRGFVRAYADEADRAKPEVSPVFASDEVLGRMCPALLVPAERDVLRTSAERYADRIRAAGGQAEVYCMPGAHHCYVEDAYNPELFDSTTMENKKAALSPDFPERAEEALKRSAEFFKKSV